MNKKINWALGFCLLMFFAFGTAYGQNSGEESRIVLKAVEGMQYDQVQVWVQPGAPLTLVFENTDKEEHNLVITKPGARNKVVMAALRLGVKGKDLDYIPEMEDVLWSIPILSEGEEDSISFEAPTEEGVYPYVCTFPGHGNVMYGAIYVSEKEALPPLSEDENIPAQRRGE